MTCNKCGCTSFEEHDHVSTDLFCMSCGTPMLAIDKMMKEKWEYELSRRGKKENEVMLDYSKIMNKAVAVGGDGNGKSRFDNGQTSILRGRTSDGRFILEDSDGDVDLWAIIYEPSMVPSAEEMAQRHIEKQFYGLSDEDISIGAAMTFSYNSFMDGRASKK